MLTVYLNIPCSRGVLLESGESIKKQSRAAISLLFPRSETTALIQLPGKTKPGRRKGDRRRSQYRYLCFPVHRSKDIQEQVISLGEHLSKPYGNGDFFYICFKGHCKQTTMDCNVSVSIFVPTSVYRYYI